MMPTTATPVTSRPVTLERIESHLPGRPIRIDELGERLQLRPTEVAVFRKIYGLDQLHYDPSTGLFDLLLPAARRALTHLPAGASLRYLIYAHTVQTVAPPDTEPAQVLRQSLGLRHTEAFALNQQACVTSLSALELAGNLLRAEAQPGDYALIVTGEQAFSPQVQLIPHSAIMAEGASAILLTLGGDGDAIESLVTRTLGQFAQGLLMDNDEIRALGAAYANSLAEVIREAIDAAGLVPDEIELVIPHNVNLITWRQTIKVLGLDPARFFLENIEKLSHCYSSDVFLNYTTLADEGRLKPGRHYLFASVGLGATFGAAVFRTRGERNERDH
ncbi:3-oxoacyl-ACP synthase III family protein [Paraburkholderia tropica]|uniref:3-oxoacyl-ACP synthase III family protein n=1 Tax=Paraburkholderia tropica TaxID=92647 RepID=UPI002AB74500|nr:3-oxoacyl-[acyl-carrier-protein] synthase III C-terminal domain-containing protein [Paraburkholderia tropica]